MDLSEFLSEFQAEASEKLDLMGSQLLRLERDASDPQPIREMFLAAHTIKGGAAMLRLTDVEALAHAVEDSLSAFRDGARTLDSATADLLFQSIDQLRSLVSAATATSANGEPDPVVVQLTAQLRGTNGRAHRHIPAVEAITPAPRRALLVDDSPTVRALYRMLLEDLGFGVVEFDDGQAALAVAQAERFELIVAGLLLKTLGGLELCAAVRETNVPVVLISADHESGTARNATGAGARALVRKGSLDDGRFTEALQELAGLTF